ncbi:MAG: hypothetical protein GWN99_01870 [Gemmatimonadetes bacterium]|uniref:Tetratricopeptide repeat protein n=1 Tax=Candidatus Kutchimonas denitrificans TaxID=3056748 RepID=A0AAE5CA53_9BACT|nr:hypothetical protein [Gemmatimonadota bacterium]NIR74192.1 hypothetical protein [Candidatus Kutchimonas denitrificans]NIR99814.1 hypothetical protein [Gemmatimonadota bacterium]NIT65403.1 hypothetical protein [Gemmatimonadota bacterium]NIU51769.1 hypothetical protein [Gemmatimonadota bacterium]
MGMTEFLLVVAVGGGIIAVLLTTFRGAASEAEPEPEVGAAALTEADQELLELEERHRAALRSLDEIETDYEAGNLSEEDYDSLRTRYEKEAAVLAQQRENVERAPAPARPVAASSGTSRGSWTTAVGWTAGAIAFVALAWLVMSQALRPRGQEGSITGSLPGQEMGGGPAAGTPLADVDMGRLAELERAVAADSSDVAALNELGHLYLTLQRYGDVAQVSMKALDLNPENPEALTHLGMVLLSVQHVDDAFTSFDRALEIDPNFAEALQFKGMVAFMSRDFGTAVEAWERYMDVVPPEEQAPRVRALLESARASADAGQ